MHTTLRLLTMARNSMQSTLQPRYTCVKRRKERERLSEKGIEKMQRSRNISANKYINYQ